MTALSKNCGIIKLDLSDNQVPEECRHAIEQELEKNKAIVE